MGPKAYAMWLLVAMPDHRIQHLNQKLTGLRVGIGPMLSQSKSFPVIFFFSLTNQAAELLKSSTVTRSEVSRVTVKYHWIKTQLRPSPAPSVCAPLRH